MADHIRMTSPMLKAMTHPLRRRIVNVMAPDVPMRAADLARKLGEPANSVSFHLRTLVALRKRRGVRPDPRRLSGVVINVIGSAQVVFSSPPSCWQPSMLVLELIEPSPTRRSVCRRCRA